MEMSNKTVNWFGPDSLERYNHNRIHNSFVMKNNKWFDAQPFSYSFNNEGFRCGNFSSNPSVMFLGCSHTFGIGMPLEKSWPQLVANSLELENVNLSWPGTSNDTAFRTAYKYIDRIKPKIVILLSPAVARCDLVINDTEVITFHPSDEVQETSSEYKKFYESWMSSDANIEMNRLKNILAIKQLCELSDIKFISYNFEEVGFLDLARDLLHFGVNTHLSLSKQILKFV